MTKKRFGISQSVRTALHDTLEVSESYSNFHTTQALIKRITLDPENPRRHKLTTSDLKNGPSRNDPDYKVKTVEYQSIVELSASIKKDGLLHPITIVKDGDMYRVVAGERRFLATQLLGVTTIEARSFKNSPTALDLKIIQWMENESRSDLSTYNKVLNVKSIKETYENANNQKLSAIKLSVLLSCSRQLAQYYLAILSNNGLLNLLEKGVIDSLKVARGLTDCKTEEEILQRLRSNGKSKNLITDKSKSVGRKRTSIAFGATKNIFVAKTIVESILSQDEFCKHAKLFETTDWDCMTSSTKAFQNLIKILEKECGVI